MEQNSALNKLLLIRRVCYTCNSFKRSNQKNKIKCECTTHNTKVPLYAYCPRWEGSPRVLTTKLILTYNLEK